MMNAGLIMPPIGLNVNTIAGIVRDIPAKDVFLGAMPFCWPIYATTLIVIVWPQIATMLPGYMGRWHGGGNLYARDPRAPAAQRLRPAAASCGTLPA